MGDILKTIDVLLIIYDNYHEQGLWDIEMINEHRLIIKSLVEKNKDEFKIIMNNHARRSCEKLKCMKKYL
jgi:DNA-binding GntR family transcriptional regulator